MFKLYFFYSAVGNSFVFMKAKRSSSMKKDTTVQLPGLLSPSQLVQPTPPPKKKKKWCSGMYIVQV